MPLTYDLYLEKTLNWKTQMNAVVSRFVDAWFLAKEAYQLASGYSVSMDPMEDKYIYTNDQQKIAQFEIMNQSYLVLWMRSVKDLENLVNATTVLQNARTS